MNFMRILKATVEMITGPQGIPGADGNDGVNGTNGTNGQDAPSPLVFDHGSSDVFDLVISGTTSHDLAGPWLWDGSSEWNRGIVDAAVNQSNGGRWVIIDDADDYIWETVEDVATPDLVTTWTKASPDGLSATGYPIVKLVPRSPTPGVAPGQIVIVNGTDVHVVLTVDPTILSSKFND